ncbi:PREDICTED: uncharacterized protein LOC106814871 isoform X1 [Priapulus caudatus]|uniref:Uncharacterized protein LOC106814871 isoform X1 n=1 Tax=Priapulus caudatus TaxID=37621 RepID=A0ABM1ERB3_PRICU|nr:PREDICTED: uncharacterized protein LOC106814871 isoform X1 [Priapulus caudatus]
MTESYARVTVTTTRTVLSTAADGTVTVRDVIKYGYNTEYIKSIPGCMRAVQYSCCLLAFMFVFAVQCCADKGRRTYFGICTETAFVTSLLFYLLRLLFVPWSYRKIPWHLIEFVEQVTWSLMLVVAAPLMAACGCKQFGFIVGVVLSFVALLAYIIGAVMSFTKWRNITHWSHTMTRRTSAVTTAQSTTRTATNT